MNIVLHAKTLMLTMGAAPIMYLMLALSIASLAIVIERCIYFLGRSDDLDRLSRELETHLGNGDLEGAERKMASSRAPEAAIVLTGLRKARDGAAAVADAMTGATARTRMKLERGLGFLATLGNNAPFIGLFGTVIGIIMAFEKLGEAGQNAATSGAGSAEVMSSIAEALVATAIGLGVAIPSVMAFNYFQRRIKSVLSSTEALSHVLLSWLKAERTGGE